MRCLRSLPALALTINLLMAGLPMLSGPASPHASGHESIVVQVQSHGPLPTHNLRCILIPWIC